ncbi:hypothetical protein BCV70DRAFT_164641, partial [Testicularia cyperi]
MVAAEQCYSAPFVGWAQRMAEQRQLAGIFFDECHVCVTQRDFRHAMDNIKALIHAVPAAKYFLTATLPPDLVPALKDQLRLPPDGTGLLRAPTNRSNICYAVKEVYGHTFAMLLNEADALLAEHATGAAMVVCLSKEEAQRAGRYFGCKVVTSDMDPERKRQTLVNWLGCSRQETATA